MKLANTTLIAILALGSAGAVCVDGQTVSAQPSNRETFTQITPHEVTLLLADVAESNPMLLKRLEEDPELRRLQMSNLRELLAIASEANKTGLASGKEYRDELENIRAEVTAINYDKHVNKGKPARPPFGYITDAAVSGYWGESPATPLAPAVKTARNAKFEQFLNAKVYILRSSNPALNGREISAEERKQARDIYAKTQIYADEYAKRAATLPLSFKQRVQLQVKLQQAQMLARLYADKIAAQTSVSDADIATYVKAHPELDTAGQRAKAEKVLARVKSGEDFAKLANEFTEDPGNKNQAGELQGGLYEDIALGVFVPPFEKAALALEAGQVSPGLVESDFGYHIIKLEKKSADKYSVRHILFATTFSDPSNPESRPVSVKEHVKAKLEEERERAIIDRLIVANKISVPEDFVVPTAAPKPEPAKAAPKAKPRPARKRT